MGKVTVKWERSVHDEQPHEFVRELATFLPLTLYEYDCAAMLGMSAEMGNDLQSRQEFRQFCANRAAVRWLSKAMKRVTRQALAKWNSGDFTKEASDNGEE